MSRLLAGFLGIILLCGCSSAPVATSPAETSVSQILTEYRGASPTQKNELAATLAARSRREGTPLLDGDMLVFVYEGSTSDQVEIAGGINLRLERMGETGVFVGAVTIKDSARAVISYCLSVNGETVRDPMTRLRPFREGSPLVEFWGAATERPAELDRSDGLPAGRVDVNTLDSEWLGESREVWLYYPPGWTPEESYPVLLVADGQLYFRDGGDLQTILDNLILSGQMVPVVAVGIESRAEVRTAEYALGQERFDAHWSFLSDELVPWLYSHGSLSVSNWVTLGFSNGGAWALYTAMQGAEVSGAITQSAVAPTTMIPDVPVAKRFYMTAGTLDPYAVSLQEVVSVMLKKGNHVTTDLAVGGHDLLLARFQLIKALKWMFPTR